MIAIRIGHRDGPVPSATRCGRRRRHQRLQRMRRRPAGNCGPTAPAAAADERSRLADHPAPAVAARHLRSRLRRHVRRPRRVVGARVIGRRCIHTREPNEPPSPMASPRTVKISHRNRRAAMPLDVAMLGYGQGRVPPTLGGLRWSPDDDRRRSHDPEFRIAVFGLLDRRLDPPRLSMIDKTRPERRGGDSLARVKSGIERAATLHRQAVATAAAAAEALDLFVPSVAPPPLVARQRAIAATLADIADRGGARLARRHHRRDHEAADRHAARRLSCRYASAWPRRCRTRRSRSSCR